MSLISLICKVCGGNSHERDHAYKCDPKPPSGVCETCDGNGFNVENHYAIETYPRCKDCNGTGRTPTEQRVVVAMPPEQPQQSAVKRYHGTLHVECSGSDLIEEQCDVVRARDYDALLAQVASLTQEVASLTAANEGLRRQMVRARNELAGVGPNSSKEFHGMGICSALAILDEALAEHPPAAKER